MEALEAFFSAMPTNSGMAFVVVLHLSPDHESHAAEILQRCTRMRVQQVHGPVELEPGHVYVIAPSGQLEMKGRMLAASTVKMPMGPRTAIDHFFRTLADVHRERAIGIVLSGMGSDGAVGVTRLKERGGVTLVQLPEDAQYDSMPKAAIATGMADFVLTVGEMPNCLVELWANASKITLPSETAATVHADVPESAEQARRSEEALASVLALLRRHTRHDFQHYKRATVLRRIERRLQVKTVPDLPAYRDYLATHPEETRLLLQDLLISVTNFFRDPESFQTLERDVIAGLFANRSPDSPVRVWVAGCATGEEAYSVAMLLREAADKAETPPDFQVFATDIDERAIAVARTGLYPSAIAADVAPARLKKHFTKEGGMYRVAKALREKVLFAEHNLLRDPPFSRLDLICCRNLLIYLERRAQINILEMFQFAMRSGGTLFLGSSESADTLLSSFTAVDKRHRIFRSTATNAPAHMPMLSAVQEPRTVVSREPNREREAPTYAELHKSSLEQLLPPSVLIDDKGSILHLSEGAGHFLERAAGEPSSDLLSNLAPPLRMELRTALYKSAQTAETVEVRGVHLVRSGTEVKVDVTVRPFNTEDGVRLVLVVFAESVEPAVPATATTGYEPNRELIKHLERDLQQLKEQLQYTIESNETSTEELTASNEELQAINEELRSATEELETSKEELQSMNEELVTVNQELKNKVEESDRINDDLLNLAGAIDIATIFVDREMRVRRFTPQARKLFNLLEGDLGRLLLDITHRLDYPGLDKDAVRAYETLREIETPVRSQDGRHYLARFLPFRTRDSTISGAVLSFIDVSNLRKAEAQARASEERLMLAAQTSGDFAIITTDPRGIITAWNAGAVRLFGFTEDEAMGQHGAIIFTAEDRAQGAPEQEMRTARAEGRAEDERWHVRKDGSPVYCSGVTTPIGPDAQHGYSKIARDATSNKREANARESQLMIEKEVSRHAQELNRMKDEFLAVMSHELKHPLNLIHLNAEVLIRLPETQHLPAVTRAGNTIRQAAANQAKIIDDLLDLSRVNTGKLTLRVVPIDLRRTVEPIVNAMRADARAAGMDLTLEARNDPLVIVADPVRVEQIIWNLLNNSVKFSWKNSSIQVRISQEGSDAKLEVHDTGRGIDPDFLPKIFEMFSQERTVYTSDTRGLGIGLSLVRDLVGAHGGRVEAHSEGLGHGASFIVWLPLNNPSLGDPQRPGGMGMSMKGVRVLVVDDSQETLTVFGGLLRLEETQVDTADSAPAALELLRANKYDLLISDIGMVGMDGFELIAAIRSGQAAPNIPAIALSGFGRDADVKRALAAGFHIHIAKPASLNALRVAWAQLRSLPAQAR